MALAAGTGKLHHSFKVLLAQWEDVKARWDDPVSRVFEEQYLVALEKQLAVALRDIDRLGQQLSRARQECS